MGVHHSFTGIKNCYASVKANAFLIHMCAYMFVHLYTYIHLCVVCVYINIFTFSINMSGVAKFPIWL